MLKISILEFYKLSNETLGPLRDNETIKLFLVMKGEEE